MNEEELLRCQTIDFEGKSGYLLTIDTNDMTCARLNI